MNQRKCSGILCHVTSLPTSFGIGDFGPAAYSFIDELARADQTYWQILPIGNTDESGCPYSTDSAFGCADYYVSPELLIKKYGLEKDSFQQFCFETTKVDFKRAIEHKRKILEIVFSHFSPDHEFQNFLEIEKDWINEYCTFRALTETRGHDWTRWGQLELSPKEVDLLNFHRFCQFVCFSQLSALKKYANSKNIKIIGDLPIFVSYNSMDVWKNPEQFFLDKNLKLEFETGAAPDAFSEVGQKWGTPIYNWNHQKAENYEWWNKRLSFLKRYFDVIRIDHFRGFCATWISKVSEPDARLGFWYEGPGEDLFNNLTDYPEVIAEDLGHITEDVIKLRDQFNFPGMKVFQYMLGDESNPHKLSNYNYNSVAYSATHDCDTLMGWFKNLTSEQRASVLAETRLDRIDNPDHWSMIERLMLTPSKIVITQVQDLLGLGSSARFNYPGTVADSNWTWKLSPAELNAIDWDKLKVITQKSERHLCG